MTNVWKEVGRREARQTDEKMEAFRDMELDTLKVRGGEKDGVVSHSNSNHLHWTMTAIVEEHQVN